MLLEMVTQMLSSTFFKKEHNQAALLAIARMLAAPFKACARSQVLVQNCF